MRWFLGCCKTGISSTSYWGWVMAAGSDLKKSGLFMFDYENLGKNLSENVWYDSKSPLIKKFLFCYIFLF